MDASFFNTVRCTFHRISGSGFIGSNVPREVEMLFKYYFTEFRFVFPLVCRGLLE